MQRATPNRRQRRAGLVLTADELRRLQNALELDTRNTLTATAIIARVEMLAKSVRESADVELANVHHPNAWRPGRSSRHGTASRNSGRRQ